MNEVITIKEREIVETREVEKSYTYEELEEIFGSNTIVYELVQRLRKLEEENKKLKEKVKVKNMEKLIEGYYEEGYVDQMGQV